MNMQNLDEHPKESRKRQKWIGIRMEDEERLDPSEFKEIDRE